jgi:hypothetical protein
VYRSENLLRLPIAWGSSWRSMADRFNVIATVAEPKRSSTTPGYADPLTWNIPAPAASGRQADFLLMHVNFVPKAPASYRDALLKDASESPRGAEPQLELHWTDAQGNQSAPVQFKALDGNLLIPLGACPRWLLGEKLQSISVRLQNPGCAAHLSVPKLTFLQLKPM